MSALSNRLFLYWMVFTIALAFIDSSKGAPVWSVGIITLFWAGIYLERWRGRELKRAGLS